MRNRYAPQPLIFISYSNYDNEANAFEGVGLAHVLAYFSDAKKQSWMTCTHESHRTTITRETNRSKLAHQSASTSSALSVLDVNSKSH